MSDDVERVARALLYEGYLLYPYRRSAVKNRRRFNFGVVCPEAWSRAQDGAEPALMQTECLVVGASTVVEVHVRFLQLVVTAAADPGIEPYQEAAEREVAVWDAEVSGLAVRPRSVRFTFPAVREASGEIRRQERLDGTLEVASESCGAEVWRLTVRLRNRSRIDGNSAVLTRDDVLPRSLVSAHTILRVREGEFVSLLDPPPSLADESARCRNVGTWPVLAGEDGSRHTMLSSPIILYDYPRTAPESAGDFFDATEIDEMLALRVLTLTDDEKREMRETDERARLLLERTESLGAEELLRLHGVMRRP